MNYFIERLPRLNTLNIYVSINITNVSLNDNSILINNSIIIPINVSKSNNFDILPSSNGFTCIRIKINTIPITHDDNIYDKYKWNNKQLNKILNESTNNSSFNCISCNSKLINFNKIKKFLPMPSELWYEMLDYWHCHKPNEEDKSSNNSKILKKFNSLKPITNGIIIGTYYFIINPSDWGLIIKGIDENKDIHCSNCDQLLGSLDENSGSYKLLKWNLKCNDEIFTKSSFVTIRLLEEINYSAVRQFILSYNDIKIKVWCFGVGIDISINNRNYNDCLKILFMEYNETVDSSIPILEITYEESLIEFINSLKEINSQLPLPLKNFKNWYVSYVKLE